MANRRMSGNNRSFANCPMPVSPWQGGMPPGSNVGMQPGISQLTDTQARLALALTNLLRPQPMQQSQQQPPSLLSMPQINLLNRPDYRQHSYGRNVRPNDNRRNRPFDKMNNRNPRNPDSNRRPNQNKASEQRKSDAAGYRTTITDRSKNKAKGNSETNSAAKARNPGTIPVAEGVKPEPQSEDSEDKKRDWKEEKNTSDPNGEGENGTANAADGAAESTEEKTNDAGADAEAEKPTSSADAAGVSPKKRNKDGRYAGIPARLLRCLVCEKSMWDGESFEKHLRGRAHKQMFDSVEESYKIQADMIRAGVRLAEEKKLIELNRMKRLGKRVSLRKETHCNMCDYSVFGYSSAHRKSEGHQRLKNFLHPRCKPCYTEFPTRIEWESHRLTPEHLLKLSEQKTENADGVIEVDLTEELPDESLEVEETIVDDNEDVILDFKDDLDVTTDFEKRLPTYKSSRAVGMSLMMEVTGNFCKPCNRFFTTENGANQHAKSVEHYDVFINLLRKKHTEGVKAKKHSLVGEPEDDEGNWKRRKIAPENDENKPDDAADPGKELYDPMEAEEEPDESEFITLSTTDEDPEVKPEDDSKVEEVEEIEVTPEADEEVKEKTDEDVAQNAEPEEVEAEPTTDSKPVVAPKEDSTENEFDSPSANTRPKRAARPGPLSKTRGRKL